jgi:hypothetical protein
METNDIIELIHLSWVYSSRYRSHGGKPGEVVANMSEKALEKIRTLKAEDLNKIRLEDILPFVSATDENYKKWETNKKRIEDWWYKGETTIRPSALLLP